MSRVRSLSTTAAILGVASVLVLTGCSNASTASSSASASAAASVGASSAASSAASAAPADVPDDETPIDANLTKGAFCLLTAPLYDREALPSASADSEAGIALAAKRLIKGTQAIGQAERLKALSAKQVAEIQVTMTLLLTLLQDPSLEQASVEEMSKASGIDTKTLQIAQTQEFKDESVAAFGDLAKFCA